MASTQVSTLKITGCRVDTQSITISFSEPIQSPGTYVVFAPNSGLVTASFPLNWSGPTVSPDDPQAVVMGGPVPPSLGAIRL